jgi:diguanylate cyclase (GGDEF)-like protein
MRRPSDLAGAARSLPARAALGVIAICALFALTSVGIGIVGVLGVRSTTRTGVQITRDELGTATATARTTRAIDNAFATGESVLLAPNAASRAVAATALLATNLPDADSAVTTLVALHVDDGAAEKADINAFVTQWTTTRSLLVRVSSDPSSDSSTLIALKASYQRLSGHLDELIDREDVDAIAHQDRATDTKESTIWTLSVAVAVTILMAVLVAMFAIRRVRRALLPEQNQSEFADTMQLADGEAEAHQLIKTHLERAVSHSVVTVLNRNNSADRLEAMTAIEPDSCLARSLEHAEPRSCLAMRSGRQQRQGGDQPALLECTVCGGCEGSSTCTPMTVGGEVIGSVLLSAPRPPSVDEEDRVRNSVSQAAPILANLRNLAIAQLRAATDGLTGLPNKRAVEDTLKRMLAQSSRALAPMAMLSIDLDNFKNVNDRYGHPVGDQALANVGAALIGVLRDSDFAGRNGGEEFAVLLPDTDLDGATTTAEKIRAAIAEIRIPIADEPLTASIGVAMYPDHATSAEHLERLADAALYVAKRLGRNRVEVASVGPDIIQDATLDFQS